LLDNLVDNATLDSIRFYGNECTLFIGRHFQFSINIWLGILFLNVKIRYCIILRCSEKVV
jgi:hypothetical protein